MTLPEFRVWLRVLAAAKATVPAALVLLRLQQAVEEAGIQDDQAQPDSTLEETPELVRRVVSSDTDGAVESDVNPDPESQPRSPWMGPYDRFDWAREQADQSLAVLAQLLGRGGQV